jgi:two-component system cell cycle sensor histidine kinase/response regulator CckA
MPVSLVLDDEAPIRKLIRTILSQEEFQTLEGENGARGMEILREIQEVDLIISDVRMPEMDGVVFAHRVRQSYPGIPIILISGCADGELSDVCDEFIEKPFSATVLLDAVKRLTRPSGTRAA